MNLRAEEPDFAGPSSPLAGLKVFFHCCRVPLDEQIHFGRDSAQTRFLNLVGPARASLDMRRRLPFFGGSIVLWSASRLSLFDRGLLRSREQRASRREGENRSYPGRRYYRPRKAPAIPPIPATLFRLLGNGGDFAFTRPPRPPGLAAYILTRSAPARATVARPIFGQDPWA